MNVYINPEPQSAGGLL